MYVEKTQVYFEAQLDMYVHSGLRFTHFVAFGNGAMIGFGQINIHVVEKA